MEFYCVVEHKAIQILDSNYPLIVSRFKIQQPHTDSEAHSGSLSEDSVTPYNLP